MTKPSGGRAPDAVLRRAARELAAIAMDLRGLLPVVVDPELAAVARSVHLAGMRAADLAAAIEVGAAELAVTRAERAAAPLLFDRPAEPCPQTRIGAPPSGFPAVPGTPIAPPETPARPKRARKAAPVPQTQCGESPAQPAESTPVESPPSPEVAECVACGRRWPAAEGVGCPRCVHGPAGVQDGVRDGVQDGAQDGAQDGVPAPAKTPRKAPAATSSPPEWAVIDGTRGVELGSVAAPSRRVALKLAAAHHPGLRNLRVTRKGATLAAGS